MSKGGSQSQSTTVDPQTQAYVNQMRQYALGAAGIGGNAGATGAANGAPQNGGGFGDALGLGMFGGGGGGNAALMAQNFMHGRPMGDSTATPFSMPALPPEVQAAMGQYANYAKGGQLGFGALTGDPNAQQQFMSPYLSQMNPFFAQQRAQAVNAANDQSTLGGAFGGDRSGIAAAVAGNQADQNQAGFNYQAFQDAMQRAMYASQLGFGATGAQAFLPQQYRAGQLGILGAGMGPYGQTQTTKTQSDPFSQLLGLGMMFLPGGPAAGLLGGGAAAGSGALPMVI
jgi:hypothetical protein